MTKVKQILNFITFALTSKELRRKHKRIPVFRIGQRKIMLRDRIVVYQIWLLDPEEVESQSSVFCVFIIGFST
jgi:glycerol-3-phosphate cytidylyltransferase-like family protein